MKRGTPSLVGIVVVLLAAVIVPFVIWGEHFEALFSLQGARDWMESLGPWGGVAGAGLLVADLALPIPGTVVMSALGWMYGWWWGGCLSAAGSIASGLLAYGVCRGLGRPAARWIAGDAGLDRAHQLLEERGGWMVAASRWLPVLPEAVACLAGLARMRFRVFLVALVCGSVPLGFAFAAIGALGQDRPGLALGLSAVVPILLWLMARRWL